MSATRIARALAVAALALPLATGCGHLVLLRDPLSAAEHNDLGVAYESAGEPRLAQREYRRALRLDPRSSVARVNLGNLEAARGRWARAEGLYRRALRDSSGDADAMNNLAVALLRRHRNLEEARALARRAVERGGARDSVYRSTLAEAEAAR